VIIAVTGTIGSGKSVVADHLASLLQAEHCDADELCRELMEKDKAGWQQVVARWGDRFLDGSRSIDRVKLREAVFSHTDVRQELEAILHPLVYSHITVMKEKCQENDTALVVEIPLLFETGRQEDFEYVVTVYARPECCIERVMARDSVSREQAMKALDAQMDIDTKVRGSHYVIDNSASPAQTRTQVEDLGRKLLLEQQQKNRYGLASKTLDS
jgi:dephospho-CoA kinase